MRDIAEYVEVDCQLVVGALQQRVVEQPHGLRDLADQALADTGAVKVAEYREQGVIVARPQGRPAWRRHIGIGLLPQLFIVVTLVAVVVPQRNNAANVVDLPGHCQQGRCQAAIHRVGDITVPGRLLKHGPEVVADYIGGNLTTAYRPADKGAHKVFSVIEHKLIARDCRDSLKGFKRIGTPAWPVTRQFGGMPVAAVEQLLDPRQLMRPHRVGDMGLVHDHALHRLQAIVKRRARVIVGATGGDQVDRLPAGRARAHPLEIMPRHTVVKIGMGKKQMLVQPARHQCFGGTRTVEQLFPLGNLRSLDRCGLDGLLINFSALRQPGLHGAVLLVGQAGNGQRHTLPGMALGIGIELTGRRADVFAVQAQDDVFGQFGIRGQRRAMPQLQHAGHQGCLSALGVEYRVKALVAPFIGAAGIVENPRWCHGIHPVALVDRYLAGTAGRALCTAEVELAGRIIAGVAGNAFFGEDRLDIPRIGNSRADQRGLCQRCTAHHQRHGAGE